MSNSQHKYHFNVRSTLIQRLGEEIVQDEVWAMVELIKNAYDADAENVFIEINTKECAKGSDLHFKSLERGFIKITDDGSGMSLDGVKRNWLTFSISQKRNFKAEAATEKKRTPVGGQGMGRLGTQRLGRHVELFTSEGKQGATLQVAFDWNDFLGEKQLTEIPVFVGNSSELSEKGTVIMIFPIRNPRWWEVENELHLADQIAKKIFQFIDRKTFNVTLEINGVRHALGGGQRVAAVDNKVYLENVWQKMTPPLVAEVVKFWSDNEMLRDGIATEERARQTVMVVRSSSDNKIVGVSTAMQVVFKQLNNNLFYLFRCIILPGYRHPGLTSKIIVETRDTLEAYSKTSQSADGCIGMLTFVENPRIQQFRREAIWPASHMAYIGMDKKGRHIRVYYFRNAKI